MKVAPDKKDERPSVVCIPGDDTERSKRGEYRPRSKNLKLAQSGIRRRCLQVIKY